MKNNYTTVTYDELNRLGELIATPTIVVNLQDVFYVNGAFSKLTGYTVEEAKNLKFEDVIDPVHSVTFTKNLKRILDGDETEGGREIHLMTKKGQWLWFDFFSKLISCNNELYLMVNLMDITEKKQMQLDLARYLNLRDAMLEVSQFVIKSEDIDLLYNMILARAVASIPNAQVGSILLVEGDFLVLSAYEGFDDEVIKDLRIPIEASFLSRATKGALNEIAKIDDLFQLGDYLKVRTKVYEDRYIRSTISAPIYINDVFFGAVNVDSVEVNGFDENDVKMMDFIRNQVEIAISNHMLYQEKTFLSRYDSLTGLFNRYYFEEAFENQKKYALRYNASFQVVLFDMNGLKKINDEFGHVVGDRVLTTYADYCKTFIRKSDILARYGGDEFVGLFFESDQASLESRLKRLIIDFESSPLEIDGAKVIVSFSFGISSFGQDGRELTTLLKVADQRMYAAKTKYKLKQGGKI